MVGSLASSGLACSGSEPTSKESDCKYHRLDPARRLGHIAWDTEGAGEFPYAEEAPERPIIPLGGQYE